MLSLIENGLKNGDLILLKIISISKNHKTTKSKILFPSTKLEINRKFAIYFKVLKLIYNQLIINESISKRQLYYMDVKLFKCQSNVDKCIDSLSNSFGLSIENLKIHASQKGLLYGNLIINSFQLLRSQGSSLIPNLLHSKNCKIVFNKNEIPKSIIILEKDSILSAIIDKENDSLNFFFENSILITGRGFPDRQTKQFISLISDKFYTTPIYGFFDADIYGLMIAIEYKFKPFNNSKLSCCPNLIIKGAKLLPKNRNVDLIPINQNDIRMIISQFNKIDDNFSKISSQLKEIQRSMFLSIKRELQVEDLYDIN